MTTGPCVFSAAHLPIDGESSAAINALKVDSCSNVLFKNGSSRLQREFRGWATGSRNPASGWSSDPSVVIAAGAFNADREMHGASIGNGGSGIPGGCSKVNEIHLKKASIAALSEQ
jgi:hypothetical protein